MNPKAEELTGWAGHEARGRPIGEVLNFLDEFGAPSITKLTRAALAKKQVTTDLGQAELLSAFGNKHVVEHSIAPLLDKRNQVIGGVIVIHDVTDRYKLMQQLTHQATHDPLTQLTNRVGFENQLSEALKSASEEGSIGHVICYLDLDQFKIVNDTCGHTAGDELLRQIAALYQQYVRKGDTLARLGGEEFGLLLELCPLEKALEITENFRKATESMRFSWENKTFSIGVSIGVAPIDGSPSVSAAIILSSVDQACYIAKSKGRNRIHVYQPGDDETSQWHEEMQWVPHIYRALDEDHFALFAQPIVPIGATKDEGRHYEILLRMKSNNGKMIAPGAFLPAAERYGLMQTLDRWVVAKAIETILSAWACNPDCQTPTFGINISGAVLSDNSLLQYVKKALDDYGLPPNHLCFEITETVAIANFTHANRFVNELKEIGCRFALDDFGSGFASFSYLKTLPVDFLKIDGSFVRHLADNKVDHTMVEVIHQLGHVMGLKTIAEFVESREIMESLREIGVDYAQGYHIGRPVPFKEVFYGAKGAAPDIGAPDLDQPLAATLP
jgi:diguanylate cyclase (GGDEF)-like protein/PAS domain S-box-containing protein